ncbi:hypothetical protein ACSHWO_00610 [Streptomyces sp. HUAS TT3]|uniref:hypothetical protein n=1 Tax=Streptomyces sp. HUAS TT3 TaxID=3447510 RepID=UPI003F65B0D2
MFGLGGNGEVADQPALEQAEPLVDGGEDTAGHEEFAQVGGGPPGLESVKRLVGQLDLAPAQTPQQVVRGADLALAHVEPVQDGYRVVCVEERLGEWEERGPDAAGAVVEEFTKSVGEGAAGAEPAAVQLALPLATGAAVGHHEARAVRADQSPVVGP